MADEKLSFLHTGIYTSAGKSKTNPVRQEKLHADKRDTEKVLMSDLRYRIGCFLPSHEMVGERTCTLKCAYINWNTKLHNYIQGAVSFVLG